MWHFGFTQPRGIAANDAGDRRTKKLGFNLSVQREVAKREGVRRLEVQRLRGKSISLPLLMAHLGGGEDPQ